MSNYECFFGSAKNSINNMGFFLGAGASHEAGYPLIQGLTNCVIDVLNRKESLVLEETLESSNLEYDPKTATPNIEEILSLIDENFVRSGLQKFNDLNKRIEMLVQRIFLEIKNVDISHHVKFLENIKNRSPNSPCQIYIFTPNYDLLLENAAAEVGIPLINGFTGAVYRYFSDDTFNHSVGTLNSRQFKEDSSLRIHLFKLHGSMSWTKSDSGKIMELDPLRIENLSDFCMILPRKRKLLEASELPFSQLFEISQNILKYKCNFLICSGYSFGDVHINQTLINPFIGKKSEKKFVNFCEYVPDSLDSSKNFPNVTHICAKKQYVCGNTTVKKSNYWEFSNFVNLFRS